MFGSIRHVKIYIPANGFLDLPIKGNFIRYVKGSYDIKIATRDALIDVVLGVNETIKFDEYAFENLIISSPDSGISGNYVTLEIGIKSTVVTNKKPLETSQLMSYQAYVYNSSSLIVVAGIWKIIELQNKHATANVWIYFDDASAGGSPDITNSFLIKAGQSYRQEKVTHTGAILAFGDILSNPDFLVTIGT